MLARTLRREVTQAMEGDANPRTGFQYVNASEHAESDYKSKTYKNGFEKE